MSSFESSQAEPNAKCSLIHSINNRTHDDGVQADDCSTKSNQHFFLIKLTTFKQSEMKTTLVSFPLETA